MPVWHICVHTVPQSNFICSIVKWSATSRPCCPVCTEVDYCRLKREEWCDPALNSHWHKLFSFQSTGGFGWGRLSLLRWNLMFLYVPERRKQAGVCMHWRLLICLLAVFLFLSECLFLLLFRRQCCIIFNVLHQIRSSLSSTDLLRAACDYYIQCKTACGVKRHAQYLKTVALIEDC